MFGVPGLQGHIKFERKGRNNTEIQIPNEAPCTLDELIISSLQKHGHRVGVISHDVKQFADLSSKCDSACKQAEQIIQANQSLWLSKGHETDQNMDFIDNLSNLTGYDLRLDAQNIMTITPQKQFSDCVWQMQICQENGKLRGRIAINGEWVTDITALKADHDRIYNIADNIIKQAKGEHIQTMEHIQSTTYDL